MATRKFIRTGECIPDRECLAKFSRENRESKVVTQIEISFPDVIKHGREKIVIGSELIGPGLEIDFRPGMLDANASCILNGTGDLIILDWL